MLKIDRDEFLGKILIDLILGKMDQKMTPKWNFQGFFK